MTSLTIPSKDLKLYKRLQSFLTSQDPVIPFIIGDGIGADVWRATQPVLDAAVSLAYGNQRHLNWMEVLAGQKAVELTGSLLPLETINAFREYFVGIKGPLSTPIGAGYRSVNVMLRRELDLYACIRPVQWIPGSPTPLRHPEKVDMVIFRENTEDIYAGIEFETDSQANKNFMNWLKSSYPEEFYKIRFPDSSGIAIKPISREGSQRFVRSAVKYALTNKRKRLTLVHKGNIMKFTEGAFVNWGYDLVEQEFSEHVYTQRQWQNETQAFGEAHANRSQAEALSNGKLPVNDVITDAALEQTLTRPEEFDVIATTNLNGDYLSDALSAQVGGLGIAPGVNLNEEENIAIFEATHGTAPSIAGKNIANPCSLILSGAMLLAHIGWMEAAELVRGAVQNTLNKKIFTFDFSRASQDSTSVSTTDFEKALVRQMKQTMTYSD